MDVDTYNDFRTAEADCPRILAVLILPATESEWLNQSPEELCLHHCAYWLSLKGLAAIKATSTIRLTIPRSNVFSADAVRTLLQRAKERKDP